MREFYNPELSKSEMEALDWANWLVLTTNQALHGSIGPNTSAVAVGVLSRTSNPLHWWIDDENEQDREDAEDVAGDVEGLLNDRVGINLIVHVGERPPLAAWDHALRLVYLRRFDSDAV